MATGPRGLWSAYVIPRGLGQKYTINTLTPKLYTTPQFYVQNWGFVKGVTCGAIIFITTLRRNWGKCSKPIYIKKDSKYKGTVSEVPLVILGLDSEYPIIFKVCLLYLLVIIFYSFLHD